MLVRELDPDVVERNYSKQPLTKAEIQRILKAVSSVSEVLNTRHKVAKENGWKEKAPSKKAYAEALLEDNNLIRRPILLRNGAIAVGKDEDALRAVLS